MLVRTTLRRPVRCLVDQARPLEDGDVLLDGREAHGVVPGQLGDALVPTQGTEHDVAPRGVRQGGEHDVWIERGLH